MNSERAAIDLLPWGRLQRLLDEMTLPTPDGFMEWKSPLKLERRICPENHFFLANGNNMGTSAIQCFV
jgi:hypothetical protein